MKKNRGREKSRPHEADDCLKRALITALEDQFYPAQKAVATQLANAVEREGFMTHDVLCDMTRQVFIPALTDEFTKQGAEELFQILRCAYREMTKGKYKDDAEAAKATTTPKTVAKMRAAIEHEQVLVLQTKARKSKVQAPGTKIGTKVQGPTPQLDVDIGGITPKPKPRKTGIVDPNIWESSLCKATEEVALEFGISGGIQQYYESTCLVGKRMLVSTVAQKAQGIYDYRINRMMYRQKRKQKEPKGPPCL